MNLRTFLNTLRDYGYSDQYTAQILISLFKAYTDYTYSRTLASSKGSNLLAVFRLLQDRGGSFSLTPEGLAMAEQLICERVRNLPPNTINPTTFFVLTFMHPHLEEPEIQFLLTSARLHETYEKTMDLLQKAGLSYKEGDTYHTPKTLYTFFSFPFSDEPFENALRQIRAYNRLSPLNPRIMKVTFGDIRDCKEEVLSAVKDMRARGIIKEFIRDKGYSFRVLDAQEYRMYIQDLLHTALKLLRFAPPPTDYTPSVSCGWDSVGLIDEYPVPQGSSLTILLFGDPGPLKQLWSQHYVYGELQTGKSVIYLSITTPPDDIRKNFSRFNRDITPFEEKKKFLFIDCYPRTKSKEYAAPIDTSSLTDFGMVLSETYQDIEPEEGVVVFDSLSNLMLYFDPDQVIKFAVNQASRLKEWGWTGIFIVEKGVNDQRIENALKFLLDGVFEIDQNEFHLQWIRGIVDKPAVYALDISERGLILSPKRVIL